MVNRSNNLYTTYFEYLTDIDIIFNIDRLLLSLIFSSDFEAYASKSQENISDIFYGQC